MLDVKLKRKQSVDSISVAEFNLLSATPKSNKAKSLQRTINKHQAIIVKCDKAIKASACA